MAKIFLYSTKPVSEKMAGPALRNWETAKVLSESHEVVLGTPNKPDIEPAGFKIVRADFAGALKYARWADIIISHLHPLFYLPFTTNKIIVLDMYNLVFFENLELLIKGSSEFLRKNPDYALKNFIVNLCCADCILCSGEKQRDVVIGMLLALGRLKKEIYERDTNLEGFIDIMQFGFPEGEPVKKSAAAKGVIAGIEETDFLLLWAGGVWDWFDPFTLIRAVSEAVKENPRIKLLFMGCRAPEAEGGPALNLEKAVELSRELGLLDKNIFFKEWVPYDDRAGYYLESGAGLSVHKDILETRYSARTRLMDYLWAKLPIICSRGDQLANLVENENLGITVPAGDVEALMSAILKMADDKAFRDACIENIGRVRESFRWKRVLEPVTNFCLNPRSAPGKPGALRICWEAFKIYFDRAVISNFR
ncbi:MAG: glycosyltransferase [Chloroflexi bacterium]|nr:glycosyltransferase [Chloroflexota bacterium]